MVSIFRPLRENIGSKSLNNIADSLKLSSHYFKDRVVSVFILQYAFSGKKLKLRLNMNEEYISVFSPQKGYLYALTILFVLRRCIHERFHLHSVNIQGNIQTKCQN
jgi:hypothetical protein